MKSRATKKSTRPFRRLTWLKRIFFIFLISSFIQCGEEEPSPWVGQYEVAAKIYFNGKLESEGPFSILVGDIPHLFILSPDELFEIVLVNNPQQLTLFGAFAEKDKDATGMETGSYNHLDYTTTLYAASQTAEEVRVEYKSTSMEYDRSVTSPSLRYIGPYRKIDSKNRDCRKLVPHCKE